MRLKINSVSFFSALMLLMARGGTLAQVALPPDYDQKLNDVVVNATRSGTPLDQMSLNTTILTKEVLESSPDQDCQGAANL